MTDEKLQFMYVMRPTDPSKVFEAEPFVTRGFCTATLHPFSSPITKDSA
jgi:hypothetical protein